MTYSVTAQNPSVVQDWIVTITEENAAPTDISISAFSIDENGAVGDAIGTFTTSDVNTGDSHTYSLVSGDGDEDNGSFSIDEDDLVTGESFDFETQSSYSIRVETNDGNGGTFQKAFTITVNDISETPTDVSISASSIDENNAVGDVIGTFTTTDVDAGETYTYTLVSGDGDDDNTFFSIDGDALEAGEVFDFETKSSYSIRVETNDGNGGTFQKAFTITVNDVSETPTDVSISASSIDENNAVGDVIGTFTTTDVDGGESYTYTLVSGDGDDDNTSFSIDGDALEAGEVFDFETKSSYSIRVESNDGNGGTFQKAFTITINDVGENVAPEVSAAIDDQSLEEDFGTITIDLSGVFTDANDDALTFNAVSSNTNAVSVSVENSTLTITEAGIGSSTVLVTADDGQGGTAVDEFVVTITEAPLGLEDAINLKVYPNPVVEHLNIESDEEVITTLSDLNGRVLNQQDGRSIRIDMLDYTRGVYLITIRNGEQKIVKRIVKAN